MSRIKDTIEQYVDQYSALVYSVCLSFVKNPFDAQDLSQETFLSAYKNLARFDRENPKAWLCTIAANKCRDYLKSPARRAVAVDTEELKFIEDSRGSAEREALDRLSDESAAELCDRLKEPYRSTARAYYIDDLSITEIGRVTGDNPKTVATRLYRANRLLRLLVKEGT